MSRTTDNEEPDMTATQEHAPPSTRSPESPSGILLVADVARIWSEIAGREIRTTTVRSYIKESKPMVGTKPGRYADNPMPAPRHMPPATTAWWPLSEKQALIDWFKSRRGQAHGLGSRWPRSS
jgi:hypothetical protein